MESGECGRQCEVAGVAGLYTCGSGADPYGNCQKGEKIDGKGRVGRSLTFAGGFDCPV